MEAEDNKKQNEDRTDQSERKGSDGGERNEESRPREPSKEMSNEGADKEDAKDAQEKKEKKKAKGTSSAKLAFLEQRYKELFTENSARKDEIKSLVSLIQDFLKEIDVVVNETQEYQLGDVEAYRTAFVDGWIRFKKKAEIDKRRFEEELKNREKSLQEELQKEKAEAGKKKEIASKEAKEQAEKIIRNLEDLNGKLQRDNNNLLNLLKAKETEISEVRQSNLELSNKAADSLMARFEKMQEEDLSQKLEQSTKLDDLIRLKNELEEAYDKIDFLEKEINTLSSRKRNLCKKDEQEGEDGSKSNQVIAEQLDKGIQVDCPPIIQDRTFIFNNSSPFSTPPAKKYEKLEEKLKRELESRFNEEEEAARQYLKNLIVKYIIYEARRNEQECSILRRAILDYLKVDSSERATIDDAISNRGGLKDSIYFLKIFGGSS